MKKLLVPSLLALSLLAVTGAAQAQAAESALSFNVGATTDYRYRGISQTGKKPALNGGHGVEHALLEFVDGAVQGRD